MRMRKRLFSVFLAMAMLIGLLPAAYAENAAVATDNASVFTDMPDNWSTEALENAVSNGLLTGDGGRILPDSNLTRAQMATVIVRAFGATVKGDISGFSDVRSSDWFCDSIEKAYQMGIMNGSGGKMNPNAAISRQEVFTILARALKLETAETLNGTFSDASKISSWAKGEVAALVNNGYVEGSNAKLNPLGNITRAEFAKILDNIIKQYITVSGEYQTVDDGNVMINAPGVTLKDLTVRGDLIIGDGVGDGNVILDNVIVSGRMVIRGGGENSIIIKGNSDVSKVIVSRVDGKVSVKVQGDANVEVIYVDDGSDDVNIEGTFGDIEVKAPDVVVTAVSAQIKNVEITGENSKVVVDTNSKVETINVKETAKNVKVEVSGTVTTVTTSAGNTSVSGSGTVTSVEAQSGASGSKIETPNTQIVVGSGVTGVTAAGGTEISGGSTATNNSAGTNVVNPTSSSGSSGSSDPSITIGAPVVSNGLTVTFSSNAVPTAVTWNGTDVTASLTGTGSYAVTVSTVNASNTLQLSASGYLTSSATVVPVAYNETQHKGYDTINAAVLAAEASDSIKLKAGTYTENVVISDKSITVSGVSGTILTGGIIAEATSSGKSLTVSGFAFNTAGIEVDGYDIVTIENNTFTDIDTWTAEQYSDGSADAIYVHGSTAGTVTIEDNTINGVYSDTTNVGDGMGITVLDLDNVTITGNTIINTWHNSINVYRGIAGAVSITDNTLRNWNSNRDAAADPTITAGCEGGRALRLALATDDLTVTGNTFTPNDFATPVDPNYVKITEYAGNVNNQIGSLVTQNVWPSATDYPTVILVNTTPGAEVAATITDGSGTDYYFDIQSAIDAAAASDTVCVRAGTYEENITINKALTLDGAGSASTILDGGETGVVVTITANNVTLKNFTIQNSGTDISSCAGVGVAGTTAAVTGTVIENNIITGNVTGVALMGTTGAIVRNNTITESARYGVVMEASPYNPALVSTSATIQNNTITNNDRDGIYAGQDCGGNSITNNTISGAAGTTEGSDFEGNGIYFWKSSGNTVTGNTISGNECFGIELMGSKDNEITENVITGNQDGFHIRNSALIAYPITGNVIRENKIYDNTRVNLYADPNFEFDIAYNWWGSALEADIVAKLASWSASGEVTPGTTINLDYSPWYTEAAMTGLAPTVSVTSQAEMETALAGGDAGTISVQNDFESSDIFALQYPVIIDGNDHTITFTSARGFNLPGNTYSSLNESEIVFRNLGIVIDSATDDRRGINVILTDSEVTLENVEISGAKYAFNFPASLNDNLTVNIDGCDISGWAAVNCYASDSVFNISNSILTGTNGYTYCEDGNNDFGTIVINDYESAGDGHDNVFTISDSTIVAAETTGNHQYLLVLTYAGGNQIDFTDCTFTRASEGYSWLYMSYADTGNTVTVDGTEIDPAEFNGDVSGVLTTSETGAVSGTLAGDYSLTITGQVSAYVGNTATFEGTVTGDINGYIEATINSNGIDTMSGRIYRTGAYYPVRIIGTFPQTGTTGEFVGEIITGAIPTYVDSMTVTGDGGATSVGVGNTLQLAANVLPSGASDDVAWSVWASGVDSDTIATIDENGLLTGVGAGTVTVIAKALDGSLEDATLTITVHFDD